MEPTTDTASPKPIWLDSRQVVALALLFGFAALLAVGGWLRNGGNEEAPKELTEAAEDLAYPTSNR